MNTVVQTALGTRVPRGIRVRLDHTWAWPDEANKRVGRGSFVRVLEPVPPEPLDEWPRTGTPWLAAAIDEWHRFITVDLRRVEESEP